jgi:MHS family alpha-ketoglutarate permease-like MFS transporter
MATRTEPSASHRLRSIIGGSVGNLAEWYDWYAYSAFSLYFAKSFFPPADQTVQLLNAAAVFAVGFLMRPLGGWLMGRYADRHGRRTALTASVLLMCAGSLLIAITPSYASIGIAAPALLVIARMMQGVSVGGEYGASATSLSEMAGAKHRGFWSSFQYVTLIMGQLLALGVLLVLQRTMSVPDLEAWGWRIPFVLGALCALVAVWLRRGMVETTAFTRSRTPGEAPASAMRWSAAVTWSSGCAMARSACRPSTSCCTWTITWRGWSRTTAPGSTWCCS